MYLLRIEHPVRDYDGWKKAFDGDPAGREQAGVLRYRVLRPVDDAGYVMIDLEFDSEERAAAMLASLRKVWSRVEGDIIFDPKARIVQVTEERELARGGSTRAA